VVVPLDRGKRHARTFDSMQCARLGYPLGSPVVVTLSTLPDGEMVIVTPTRAFDGASGARDTIAGSQHPRRTLELKFATTR
jgi:hypothetical protein